MNLSEPDFWRDGLFCCDTEVSKKAAIQFSVDRFNQRALLPTTYKESNKTVFRYDYTYNYQSKYFRDNSIIELADKIINGELIVYGTIAPLKFSIEKFNWNIRYSNIPNTFQLYLQAFNFLQILVRAYELVRNAKYLQKGYELIKSWGNFYANEENKLSNKYVYCDHSVALRTENLLYFAKTCNSHAFWGKEMFDLIESILFENGNWLSNEKNYSKVHNHGIMQDKALLQLGFCMQNSNWIELAKKRLEEQKNTAFNEEYVHVENSPYYAQIVRKIFLELADFLESNNDEFGKLLRNDMEKVQEYINWAIKPNGIVSQVGDSINPVGVLYADKAKQKRHTEDIHAIYPVTGQYFYRYSFDESPQNDTWKFIKSGYTSTTHKHADDLSFMLYSRGYEIFTDSGIYGYVKNVYRRYFTSALAHNSIIVDNQSYDVKNENSRFFGLSEYELSEYFDRVTLFNNAYNGVKIQRDFCSCGDLTVIYDFIESSDYHVYSQLFHLAENISVADSSDTHVRLKIGDSGYYADIIQLGDPCRAYVINGNLSIPQYGLLSRAENHLEVSTTIKFDTISETGLFVTVIAITDSNGTIQLSHDESCNIDDLHFDANNVFMQTPQRCIESSFSKINLDETVLETNTVLTDKKIKFNLKIRKPYIGRLRFAYYLYKEDEVIEKRMYDSSEEQLFNIKGNGSYRVKYFLSDGNQKKSYWGEIIKIKL